MKKEIKERKHTRRRGRMQERRRMQAMKRSKREKKRRIQARRRDRQKIKSKQERKRRAQVRQRDKQEMKKKMRSILVMRTAKRRGRQKERMNQLFQPGGGLIVGRDRCSSCALNVCICFR